METLEHNGVTYVKVSVLAKRFNYTTDYIGQLCRQGKVEAKLVGRSWFVRESSLLEHGSDRLKNTRPNEILSKINAKSLSDSEGMSTRVNIFPQLSKHSHRTLFADAPHHVAIHITPEPAVYQTSSSPRYSPDVSESLPTFNYLKPIVSKPLEPVVTEARHVVGKKISVHAETKGPKKLVFSSLPEVSLRGSLLVHSLDTEDDYVVSAPVALENVPLQVFNKPLEPANVLTTVSKKDFVSSAIVMARSESPSSLVPAQHLHSRQSFPFFIPLVFLFSVTIATTLMSLSSLVESDGAVLNQSLRFNVAQVFDSLSQISVTRN
jgi:hypothetical protein